MSCYNILTLGLKCFRGHILSISYTGSPTELKMTSCRSKSQFVFINIKLLQGHKSVQR